MSAEQAANRSITMLYARAANGAIGLDGTMPWHLSEDLKHFKRLTMGKPMIMGRKTYESFPAPLPGRRHIVLTRDESWSAPVAEPVKSVEQALALAGEGEIAIVGGAEIYALFQPMADRIELTEILAEFEGDTFVPDLGPEWREVARQSRPAEGKLPAFDFVTYERRSA